MLPALTFVILGLAWQWGVTHWRVPGWILPAPLAIATTTLDWQGELLRHTGVTLVETVLGFLAAVVLAVPLAMAVVSSRLLRATLYPVLLALQSIPKVALAPLVVLWVGFGLLPKVVVVFLVCFFPIVVSTVAGLEAVPATVLDLMRALEAGPWQVFRRVRLPTAIPHILVGCKIAVTFAVIGAVIAEFVGSEEGLGYLILTASAQSRTDLAFAALVVLTVLSVLLFYGMERVEAAVLRRLS